MDDGIALLSDAVVSGKVFDFDWFEDLEEIKNSCYDDYDKRERFDDDEAS